MSRKAEPSRNGVALHVYLPPDLMAKLKREAAKRGYPTTITSVVRQALEHELKG